MSDDVKMGREMGEQVGAMSAVLQILYLTAVEKRELSHKAELSIFQRDRKNKIEDASSQNEFPP